MANASRKLSNSGRKPATTELIIRLQREARCGEHMLKRGDELATVRLQPQVELNYVIDALRSRLATEHEVS